MPILSFNRKILKTVSLFLMLISFTACITKEFKEQANQKFGDQHFKTAISLIELHKVREGQYPETLDSLKFTGDWDMMVFSSVKYTKLEEGYDLDLINGWVGKPQHLKYPPEFWKGLGLRKSNMK